LIRIPLPQTFSIKLVQQKTGNLLNTAIDTLLNSVRTLCPKVTESELAFLKSGLSVTQLRPKQFYISANKIQKEIGFVAEGLLRGFCIDSKGNEITVKFCREREYATHYTAFITQTPGKYYFQCIEPAVIVNLSFDHIQRGYNAFPNLERYGRLVAEEVLKLQQKRIEGFLFDSAETRYLDFIHENPDLFNRVSLSHLSSYLGIERQSLTRIRRKLAGPSY
jgi:CRP-like cAMP-binding protein